MQRFGYIKSPGNLTGFIGEDDHHQPDKGISDFQADHWIRDFNSKMLQSSITITKTIPDQIERCKRVAGLINDSNLIEKYKAKRNAGWRAFREKVKEIANSSESNEK